MSSEDFKSLIVTDPDLVDEGIDVSGLKTTTDTSPFLLGNIPDYSGIQYDYLGPTKYTDLMRLYSSGLPMFDTPQAAAPPSGGGGGGGGTTPTQPDSIGGFDPGVVPGPSGFIGLDPEYDVSPFEFDDAQTYDPPTPPSGITGDDVEVEDLINYQLGDDPTGLDMSGTMKGAPVVGDFNEPTTGTISDDRLNEVIGGQPMAAGPFDYLQEQTPLSQVQVPGLDYSQADIDAERLAGYTPSFDTPEQENTVQTIFGKVGQTVEGALTELGKIPGAIVDATNKTVDIFGKKLNVGATLAKFAINKAFGGPISLVFDIAKAVLPEESLADKTTRSIVDELKAENDYGFNMQSGNLNQDPFGRNPVSGLGDYEQTLKEDILGINQSGFQTAKMREKKKEFAQDYFNKKAEKAGGVEVEDGTVLGPGEAPGEVVTLDDLLQEQQDKQDAALIESISGDIGVEGLDDETGRFGGGADMSFDADRFDAEEEDEIYEPPAPPSPPTGTDRPGGDRRDDSPARGGGADMGTVSTGGPPSQSSVSTPTGISSAYSSYSAAPKSVGGGGGNDGGGGSSKIVCTMMNDSYGFGSFRNKIWLRHSKDMAPEYQKGYHKIFLPLVKIAKTNKVVKKVLEHIAVHRTIDIRQESRGKIHLLGRVYRKILEPICYIVGKYAK